MALARDGHGHANATSATPSASLTTAGPGVVCCLVTTNGGPVTGVAGSTLGAFTRVGRSSSGGFPIELWRAYSSGALSSEVITVTNTSSAFTTIDVWGIASTPSSSALDSDASNPSTNTDASTLTIDTVAAACFICGGYRLFEPNPTAGAGLTLISGADYQLAQYAIVSSAQNDFSFGIGTGNGFQNGGIVAAFVEDAGGNIYEVSGSLAAFAAASAGGALVLDLSGSLAAVAGAAAGGALVIDAAGTLAAIAAATGSGGLVLEADGALAIDLDIAGGAAVVVEAAAALGLGMAMQGSVLAEIAAAASLGVSAGLSAQAGAVLNVAATLAARAGLTGSGASDGGSGDVEPPAYRTIRVSAQGRSIDVPPRGTHRIIN